MSLLTRFAPSPTGWLHLGHAYAAWFAWDAARRVAGGYFLLRHEDIDGGRVREEFYAGIEEDLHWLGLEWDGEVLRQSDRLGAYLEAMERLRGMGVMYRCFCTRREIQEELARMGGAPHEGEGVVYPGICRGISADEVGERVARGEVFAWRFDSGKAAEVHGDLFFEDELVGLVRVDAGVNGDVVLARKDIAVGYHLAVVVDDAFQGVNLVTRGEDLLGATHVQRQLQALLGLAVPGYFHHRLLRDEAGKRLAKRDDARSIRVLRDGGISAVEVMERVRRGG